MQINLFKLHDPVRDDKPKKWICANGKRLKEELHKIIDSLTQNKISRTTLVKHFMEKFNISHPTACRLVYLRKEWYPLVFIEELLVLSNRRTTWPDLQKKIDFLKCSQPPVKILRAHKELTVPLCKIAGAHAADGTLRDNFFCITDRFESNLIAFNKWLKATFCLNQPPKRKGSNEWKIAIQGKVFSRYLTKILGFPNGTKTETVKEPKIIRKAGMIYRKAFATGALTFEAGFGIRNQVELCVLSKKFRDDIAEVLKICGVKFVKMSNRSGRYWRLWSGKLNKEEAEKWLELFELHTAKWNKLYCHCHGNNRKVKSFDDALKIFEEIYPVQTSSKVTIADILLTIRNWERHIDTKLSMN